MRYCRAASDDPITANSRRMFMVEPADSKPDPHARSPPSRSAPPHAPWPAHSPLDPAANRFRGAARYQIWRRGARWTAVAEGPQST
ncbi:hypothetical protein A11M_0106745, partial [Xanthomonas vasicola pv. vasculorum NCPPB 895]